MSEVTDGRVPMRVAFFPNWRRNPYLELLDRALGQHGVSVFRTHQNCPDLRWLRRHRYEVDVVHFHWLHNYYQRASFRSSLTQVVKFAAQLAYAGRLGYRIAWTMHNLYPHERLHHLLDVWMRRVILRYAHAVFVHCGRAEEALAHEFGRRKRVYVAPLGNYIGALDGERSRCQARWQLGLPQDSIVFLHLGALRPYKGIPRLIHSFMSLPDPRLRLIVAGPERRGYRLSAHLPPAVERDSRIQIDIRWVPDDEVVLYHAAADVVVAPFQHVLTSSSVMLALSMARPVVAPALGCLPELVSPDAGLLYEPSREEALREALVAATQMPLEMMGLRAFEIASSHTWDETARVVAHAYDGGRSIPASGS